MDPTQAQALVAEANQLTEENRRLRADLLREKHIADQLYAALRALIQHHHSHIDAALHETLDNYNTLRRTI